MAGFGTKNFLSIVAGMVNQMKGVTTKITYFSTGAVSRTMVEACAEEIDELYQKMLQGLVDAIPVAVYLAFNFNLLLASAANGIVTLTLDATVTSDTIIPAGTQVATDGRAKTYNTLVDAVIPAGQLTVSVGVACTVTGVAGNIGSGEITQIIGGAPNLSVTNAAAFTNGTEDETDDQRRLRFNQFIDSLSRGPLNSIEYGLKLASITDPGSGIITERVTNAIAVELYRISSDNPLGYVDAYIYNGGSGATPALVTAAQGIIDGFIDTLGNLIPGFKAAGVIVRVHAVTLITQAVTMHLRTSDGTLSAEQDAAVRLAMADYFASIKIGGTLWRSKLEAAALTVDGIIDARVPTPTGDVTPLYSQLLVPGVFTLNTTT